MAFSSSSSYMIYHPENLRISDIFSKLVFGKTLEGSGLVECSPQEMKKLESVGGNLITLITLILQKILIWLSVPLALFGLIVEFWLNLVAINGGILKLFFRTITGSVVIPERDSADYRSILGHIDGRIDLQKPSSFLNFLPNKVPVDTVKLINPLDLCMMAAKVAYENQAYVYNAVTNHWKMHMVGFFNFWNEFLEQKDTQAFIFCDRPVNAQLIVVAFRGTEVFSGRDWSTDVDLSWLSMGKMGRVHLGFMKALGLQNAKDYENGWPKEYTGDKELAYYTIREKLKALLQQNIYAKILVTGHSLGGALAAIFPAILMYHQEDTILNSLWGVYTFGQPRVGDKKFGIFMEENLNATFKRYYRMVYRYDIIPRVPFDDLIFHFAHFGGCLYYRSWYKAKVLNKEPDGNYFNILYVPSKYFNAWLDFFRSFFAGIRYGKEFKESYTSIGLRIFGLLIPGFASHSPRDYVNGIRLGEIVIKNKEEETIGFEYDCMQIGC